MFENLEPPTTPTPGPDELGTVKHRAAVRRRNVFLLGAGSGASAVAVIAVIVVALVSAGSSTKDVNTVGRPGETTTTEAPTTTAPAPPPAPAAVGARQPAPPRRSAGHTGSPAPAKPAGSAGPLIAFVAENTSAAFQVDVVNLDGSGRRTLWRDTPGDRTSVSLGTWSPDGRLLAVWTHFSALGGGGTAFFIDQQGRVAGQVDDPDGSTVAWSPDGSRFAFGGSCPSCPIPVYDSSTFRQVGTVDKLHPAYLAFAWGPNERMAAVEQKDQAPANGVFTVAADNTDVRQVVAGNVYAGYTHDLATGPGNRIYYFDANGLNVVRDEPGATPVTLADTAAVAPVAPSPDGSVVAYRSNSSLRVVSSDGGEPKTLATSGGCPAFSPDGRLLFGGAGGMWISDADGRNAHMLVKLTMASGVDGCPVPSPS